MTEQRFDIIVSDKVDASIGEKLVSIGGSATAAAAGVKALNTELAQNSARSAAQATAAATAAAAGTARMQAAATSAAAAQARLTAEQTKASVATEQLSAAQVKSGIAAEGLAQAQAKTALAQQRVATETARTAEAQSKANIAYVAEEEALNKAIAAEDRAIAQKAKLAAAAEDAAAAQVEADAKVAKAAEAAALAQSQAAAKANHPITIVERTPTLAEEASARPAGYQPGAAAAQAEAARIATLEAEAVAQAMAASAAKTQTATTQVTASVTQMETKSASLLQQLKTLALDSFDKMKIGAVMAFESMQTSATSAFGAIRNLASNNGTQFQAQTNAMGQGATNVGSKLSTLGGKAGMTALSIRELLVVARESSRGDFTRMAGSLSILAMSLDVLAPALAIAGTGFLTLYAARKSFNTDAEQSSLKEYANTLGLTTKEMRKLQDTTLDAKGHLKELNLEQITYADTFNGLVKTIEDGFSRWRSAGSETASWWSTAFQVAGQAILAVYNGITAGIIATAKVAHNLLAGTSGPNITTDFITNTVETYKQLQGAESKFVASWKTNTDQSARDRLKAEADAIKNNRNPKKPKKPKKEKKPWDRAGEMTKDNRKLDDETASLEKYGQALTEANALEEISKKYAEHKVPLTEAETAAFRAKIHAYEDGKRVQSEMTKLDEEFNGPARKYTDTQDALDKLLAQGAITATQYAAGINMAARALEDATDPLAALNRELQRGGELVDKYGQARDVATYIQSLAQAAEAKGQSIYKPGKATGSGPNGEVVVNAHGRQLTDQAQGMVDEYKRQKVQTEHTQAFQAIDPKQKYQNPNDSSYLLDNHKKLYADIAKLRDGDTEHEAEAAEKKKNLDYAYRDAKLSTTSAMLGQLAGLQSSHNRTVAAFGKAAAVGQATIDGYRAVQAALIGPPGPPWSFAIAGVTAAMTAANVAKIAGIGFQAGGYTGNMPTNAVAGAVHGQEYVFDAAATRRLGVPALDAMRRGSLLSQPPVAANSNGQRVSVYPQPGVFMEEVSTSDNHIEMIAHRVTKANAGRYAAEDLRQGSNTHMGKAMRSSYGLARADR